MALEFGVKIEGLDRLLKKYGKDEFDRAAQAGLEAGMQIAVNGAKRRLQANVKTGALRNSITFQRRGMDGWVGSNLNYARWVEEGTGVYGPMKRPFGPRRAKVMRWTPKTPTGAPGKKSWTGCSRGSRTTSFCPSGAPG